MSHLHLTFGVCAWFVLSLAQPLAAQPLGTFRWQLQPYCNVITVSVTQQNAVYTLDGTDDRCGLFQAASAVGIAFLNPNGTVGFGVTTVMPGGTPIHLEAALNIGTLSGTWRDSSGNNGTFALTPGASTGGPPRPVASGGVPVGSITAVQLAPGAVTAPAIAANAITGANVIDGSLTGVDLVNGAIGPSQISANAVTGGNVADASLTRVDILDAPRATYMETLSAYTLSPMPVTIVSIAINAPAPGRVIVNTSGYIRMANFSTSDRATCAITTGTTLAPPYSAFFDEIGLDNSYIVPLGGTRGFTVAEGNTSFRLICEGSGAELHDVAMTAHYISSP